MALRDLFKNYNKDGEYDEDYSNGYEDDYETENEEKEQQPVVGVQNDAPRTVSAQMNLSGNSIELKVVRPESFKNADQIAEHLLNRRTVVLNLEAAGKETAKRLIDFLSGVAFAIKGDIRKVSNNTYVITPGNVTVSGDPMVETEPAAEEAPASADGFKY